MIQCHLQANHAQSYSTFTGKFRPCGFCLLGVFFRSPSAMERSVSCEIRYPEPGKIGSRLFHQEISTRVRVLLQGLGEKYRVCAVFRLNIILDS